MENSLAAHGNGVTVPEAVRQILNRNYPIHYSMKMKIVNFHALAALIQDEVRVLTGKEASLNALVVAVKRFSDTLAEAKTPDPSGVLKDARLSLTSGTVDLTIQVPRTQFSSVVKELSQVGGELPDFPHIFPLSNSIKVILPREDYEMIRAKLGHIRVARTQENVAKLTLSLSPTAEMPPGIASYITELLYRNGVNILDAFLGYGDVIMVVDEQDGPLAYDVLQKEVHRLDR